MDSAVSLPTLIHWVAICWVDCVTHPLNSWLGPHVCIRPIPLLYYTRTIPQRPPSRQRKRGCCREALERWPLWRGRGVIWHLSFFQGCNILIFPQNTIVLKQYIHNTIKNKSRKQKEKQIPLKHGVDRIVKKKNKQTNKETKHPPFSPARLKW